MTLLQDDVLGENRETNDEKLYSAGLNAILSAENNYFFVASLKQEIVGCFQLTFIDGLSRGASKRSQIESVRVKSTFRGQGIGKKMMLWAIDYSQKNGCSLVQLTTDKTRNNAHDFYLNMGFTPSHIGMKLNLTED